MLPGETKPDNLRAKGITDMCKDDMKNMLSALGTPGSAAAKHLMHIELVDDNDKQSKQLNI
jgi:hypothetical protein